MKFLPGKSGNPAGPPRKTVPAHALPLVTKLAARGVREKDMARVVADMSGATWIAYKKDHPELVAAIDAGRQVMHDALVGKMYELAMAGDTRANEFLLRVVFGYREDAEALELRPQITISLPAASSVEQYTRGLTIDGVSAAPSALEETTKARRG